MLEDLQKEILKFVQKRDWEQFHTPKNLSTAISIEANELLENFVWDDKDFDEIPEKKRHNVKEELADILIYSLEFFHRLDIDPEEAVLDKIEQNREKYPVEKAKGNSAKYTELEE